MKTLIKDIHVWRRDKGITNLITQQNKVLEEIGEFAKALNRNNRKAMKIELGDIGVSFIVMADIEDIELLTDYEVDVYLTLWDFRDIYFDSEILSYLSSLAENYDLDLKECIQLAHNKNVSRKGETINGNFVKKDDLKYYKSDYSEVKNKPTRLSSFFIMTKFKFYALMILTAVVVFSLSIVTVELLSKRLYMWGTITALASMFLILVSYFIESELYMYEKENDK